jgi:hypothetical protein
MTIKRLEIFKEILIRGPPYDATIDINNFFASPNDPTKRYF